MQGQPPRVFKTIKIGHKTKTVAGDADPTCLNWTNPVSFQSFVSHVPMNKIKTVSRDAVNRRMGQQDLFT